jgi:hypothetical protein
LDASKVLRIALLVTVGLPYLALKGLWLLLRRAWRAVVLHRGLQILVSALGVILLLAAWKGGPLLLSRAALVDAAGSLARQSEGRNTLDVENDLRRRAFCLGFRGALAQPGAVSVERTYVNGIALCTIRFEFRRPVGLFGFGEREIAVSGHVEEAVEPPGERKSLDEILVR